MKTKNKVIYNLNCGTEKGILRAEKIQNSLYKKYNSVKVYPNGSCGIRIIASDKIK